MPQAPRAAVGRTRVESPRFRSASYQFPESLAYQVLARKWRPQRFDDVIGQRGVTQTLRNAIAANRIAQSFVFSGPRGVGKTTTARILARALNCEKGPTADPCGVCDACIEIAEGRDIDVFEIDAATHTQVDKVREIIIAGLGMAPVRNRYKIFIIDEVHRLSPAAFDALLKSIEEPPPHVVFMMATTEIEKVPATIQSRSQVFELKTIGVKAIADQLRRIADSEKIAVDERRAAADCARRRRQHARRPERARPGDRVCRRHDHRRRRHDGAGAGAARSADRDGGGGRARGCDRSCSISLRGPSNRATTCALVIRELARLTRDLLVLGIDPSRVSDPEIAAEGERQPLLDLAAPLLARRLDAGVRRADQGRSRYPRVDAAAISPGDGAAAVDSPAQAGAVDRPDRPDGRTRQARPRRQVQAPGGGQAQPEPVPRR